MYPDKYATEITDVPDKEHWVILLNDGVYIPGDERSITNPGHGYPEEKRSFLSYKIYLTKEKLLEAIQELENPKYGSKQPYKVLKVTPVKIETKLTIDMKD